MAIEPIRSRVTPRVTLSGGVNAAAYAGLAPALADVAQTGVRAIAAHEEELAQQDRLSHQLAMEQKKRSDEALHVERSVAYATGTQKLQTRALELRNDPDRLTKLETETKAWQEEFFKGSGDNEDVRQRFVSNVAEFSARLLAGAEREELATNEKALSLATDAAQTMIINRNSGSLEGITAGFAEIDTLYDGQTTIHPALVPAAKREAYAQMVLAAGRSALETGQYEAFGKALDAGMYGHILDDETEANFKRSIGIERDQAGVAVRREQAEAVRAAKENFEAFQAESRAGVVHSEADFARMKKSMAVLDPKDRVDFTALRVAAAINRGTQGWSAEQLSESIAATETRQAAGKATKAEQMGLVHLRKRLDMQEDQEAEQAKALLGQGVTGTLQALASMKGDPATRERIAEKMKPGLGLIALQGPGNQRLALEGRAARETPARKDDFGDKAETEKIFARSIGRVRLGPAEYQQYLDHARDLYAGVSVSKGNSGFDPHGFDAAVRRAFGAKQRGDGQMVGGLGTVRGRRVQLPDDRTAEEFDAFLSRRSFEGAVISGRPADKADVLSNFMPEWVGNSAKGEPLYYFVGPDGKYLAHKSGAAFQVMVTKP